MSPYAGYAGTRIGADGRGYWGLIARWLWFPARRGTTFRETTHVDDWRHTLLAAFLARVRGELFEVPDIESDVRAMQALEMMMRSM
jgi:hypothetical protein